MSDHWHSASALQTQESLKKKHSIGLSTTRTKTNTTKSFSVSHPKCLFCQKKETREHPVCFPQMIKNALYSKYSSSQNYYYAKDINEILNNVKTVKVIRFKDDQHFDEAEEYLKRFYKRPEYDTKIRMLAEYYKFHKDIARIFMKPIVDTINRYHDKKRRYEYIKVTKMLKEQTKTKSPPKKKPEKVVKKEEPKDNVVIDRILVDLDTTAQDAAFKKLSGSNEVKEGGPRRKLSLVPRGSSSKISEQTKTVTREESTNKDSKKAELNISSEGAGSNTLHELNMKLSEIITATHSRAKVLDFPNFFENSMQMQHPPESITNLDNFLKYLQEAKPNNNNNNPAINKEDNQNPKVLAPKRRTIGMRSTPRLRPQDSDPKIAQTERPVITNMRASVEPANNRLTPSQSAVLRPVSREEIMKSVLPEMIRRQSTAKFDKVEIGEDEKKARSVERVPSAFNSSKGGVSTHTISGNTMIKLQNLPSVSKIKNFEEILKLKPQNSPLKLNLRAVSRDGRRREPASISSRRHNDFKAPDEPTIDKSLELMNLRRRRKSSVNGEMSKSTIRLVQKDKSVYNIKHLDKTLDGKTHSHHAPEFTSNDPMYSNSHREMRITVDLNSIGKHISQQGLTNTSNQTHTGKALSGGTRTAANSGNIAVKIISQKAMSIQPVNNNNEANMGGTIQLNRENSNIKIVPVVSTQREEYKIASSKAQEGSEYVSVIRATPENTLINIKNNVERFLGKAVSHREGGSLANRKLTKSEERLGKLDSAFGRNASLPYARTQRGPAEQTTTYEGSRISQDASNNSGPRQQIYYNHNNIVNIYMHANAEKLPPETIAGLKSTTQKMPIRPHETIRGSLGKAVDQKIISEEFLIKQNQNQNQSQVRKPDTFNETKRYNSPLRIVKRDTVKLSHTKSGSHGSGINFGTMKRSNSKLL